MEVTDKAKRAKTVRRLGVLLAIGLVAGLGLWHASLRVDAGPAAGWSLEGMPSGTPAAGPTLCLATFNMAGGKGPDGQRDLGLAADALAGERLDFVALQEVHGTSWPQADNQAATLARRLKMGWLYAPAETRWCCRQFGNGVLSRLPVRSWQRIPLPCEHDRSRRNAVLLVLDAPGGSIRVLATHLTQRDPRDREVQLRAVIELFLALDEPAVLLGDLNSTPDDPAIRKLLARPGVDDPVGRLIQPSPKGRVDWILLRGLKAIASGSQTGPFSDHPLYTVDIAWPEAHAAEPAQSGGDQISGPREVK